VAVWTKDVKGETLLEQITEATKQMRKGEGAESKTKAGGSTEGNGVFYYDGSRPDPNNKD